MLRRIHKERLRLRNEVRQIEAKLSRVNRQLELKEDEEENLVNLEWRNISEMEDDESSPQLPLSDSNDFLFDLNSEQLEPPSGLDWSLLAADPFDFEESTAPGSDGIIAGGSGSSQGS